MRSAPDDAGGEPKEGTKQRRERRRRRAHEAGLQSIVRKLANRPAPEPEG